MLNKFYEGKITSVSAGVKSRKTEDGVKEKYGIYKIKIESNSIPYEDMANFNSSVAATLLNIQPMPFDVVNFGDQSMLNTDIEFSEIETEETKDNLQFADFKKIKIVNLTVKNKSNIPSCIFSIEIPIYSDGKFLFSHISSFVNFKISQGAGNENNN